MRTPEEIKKALKLCTNTSQEACDNCPYRTDCARFYSTSLDRDALAYIQQLEAERDKYRAQFERTYDKLEKAYKDLDGIENCTNCVYGDGTIEGTAYCYDCRWFSSENNKVKWTAEPPKEDV